MVLQHKRNQIQQVNETLTGFQEEEHHLTVKFPSVFRAASMWTSSMEKEAVLLQCLLSNSDTPQGPETHSPNWPSCGVWMSLAMNQPRMNSQAWVPTISAGSSTGKALSNVQGQEFTLLTSTMGTLYLGHAGDLQRQQSKVSCREETSRWATVAKTFSLKSWVLQDEKDSN